MNVLVTGSHGFAGTALRERLRARGDRITGTGSGARDAGPGETFRVVDLTRAEDVRALVHHADPDVVFHLAARAGRGDEAEARRTVAVNVLGTMNLYAALLDRTRRVRVVHVGSSAQYGAVPATDDPVDETAPLNPLGVYGWTKAAAEAIALAHHGRGGIEVVAIRAFNHTGPGEPEHLACSSFAKQIAAIEVGAKPVIQVGSLEAVRDLTDVRDLARGYVALAERGEPGTVYNLCSGHGTRMSEVLRMLLDKSTARIEVRADPSRTRAAELARQVGSFERAQRATGWQPVIPLTESLDALLAEWRARHSVQAARGPS